MQRRRVRPARWDGRRLRSRRRVSRQPLAHERKRPRPRPTTASRGTGPGWQHPTRDPRVDRSDRSRTPAARQAARRPRRTNGSDIRSSSRAEERASHQIDLLGTRLRAAVPPLGHIRRHRTFRDARGGPLCRWRASRMRSNDVAARGLRGSANDLHDGALQSVDARIGMTPRQRQRLRRRTGRRARGCPAARATSIQRSRADGSRAESAPHLQPAPAHRAVRADRRSRRSSSTA